MRLYNPVPQAIETFDPAGDAVSMYVCGITPYDTTHLGHAFTYCAADILIRYLEFQGRRVHYVQNVTDIDDDILRKAREVGEDWRALGNRWTAHFIRDMISLNVRPPDDYPRATEVIPEIVQMVSRLIEKGAAYESGGSVYFDVNAWPSYGKLSHLDRAEMLPIANERGNNPNDPHKRDPLDFVLWQAQSSGEPAWDSPWRPGRPGWHIECSVMSTHFLGETVDLHGGGSDLVFPHHESEIAQVVPVTGQEPFARFWFHTAMVRYQGEKMSKSLGNLVMVDDLLKTYSPDALRLYLANHHYRLPWSHDPTELDRSQQLAAKLRSAAVAPGGQRAMLDTGPTNALFTAAMENDLDTPAALVVLTGLADEILEGDLAGHNLASAQTLLRRLGRVFGLQLDASTPEERVTAGWEHHLQRFSS